MYRMVIFELFRGGVKMIKINILRTATIAIPFAIMALGILMMKGGF